MSDRMTRRTFLQLTGAGAAAALLAACAPQTPAATQAPAGTTASEDTGAEPAAEAVKLVFSSYTWSGYEAAMRGVIDDFMAENPDVEVEGQFVPEDYWTKLQTQVAGGTPPDVGISDYALVITYAKDGVLLDITDLIAGSDFPLDKMLDGAVAQYRWAPGDFASGADGAPLWGLPSDAQGQLFAYNKDMFDAAGVDYPTDDWTWNDLVAAGKAITNPDENKWGFLVPGWGMWVRGWYGWQAGGEFVSADYRTATFDSPGIAESIKWMWDLIYTEKIAPPPGLQAATNPFMSGQVAMVVDGIWWVADFKTIEDFDWDMAMMPKHPRTGSRVTTIESDGWWVFKGTKEVDASFRLLTRLAGEEGQRKFGELEYVVPSCFPEVGTEWYSKTPPENREKALDNLVEESRKAFITFNEVWTVLGACMPPVEAAFADGLDIDAAIQECNEIAQEELDRAWELFEQ
ncbi:MAG: sugar ABC transporter substrate-binding protein [Chloroflexi bacterium]|nr:sugar ABC transporter substrate-binding protein [Chloroflexota bacterium]